jgi:hypothetical protein
MMNGVKEAFFFGLITLILGAILSLIKRAVYEKR